MTTLARTDVLTRQRVLAPWGWWATSWVVSIVPMALLVPTMLETFTAGSAEVGRSAVAGALHTIGQLGIVVGMLMCVTAVHEFGHLAAARMFDLESSIAVAPLVGATRLNEHDLVGVQGVVVALGGPVASACGALLCDSLMAPGSRLGSWFVLISWVSVWGNLLPIPMLDGGLVLRILLKGESVGRLFARTVFCSAGVVASTSVVVGPCLSGAWGWAVAGIPFVAFSLVPALQEVEAATQRRPTRYVVRWVAIGLSLGLPVWWALVQWTRH